MNKIVLGIAMLVAVVCGQLQADVDASRIVSVDANATEILMGLGYEQNLVAVDVTSQSLVSSLALPDLGYHRALSAEGVLSAGPSLVIGSTHMGPPPVVAALKGSKIPLIQLEAATNVEELIENIEHMGSLVNRPTAAQAIIDEVKGQVDTIAASTTAPKTMVFLLDMSGRGLSKAGHGTTGEALISLLGGENLSDYGGYKTVAMEALMELDPDVILVGSRDANGDAAKELLDENPLLMHSTAAKNHRILNVDSAKMVAGVSLGVVKEALRLSLLVK